MPRVDDPNDRRLDPFRWRERQLASRNDRLEAAGAGMFVAEGDLVVERSCAAGCVPVAILCAPEWVGRATSLAGDGGTVYAADDDVRREVTGLGVPLGMVGLFRRPPLRTVDEVCTGAAGIVALEAVDNPTNLGAVVRSAGALGWGGLLLDSTCADPLARRALRVAMGASFALPFARLGPGEQLVDAVRRHGLRAVALTPDPSATDLDECAERLHGTATRTAVLFGSERSGLSDDTLERADERVRIPMHARVDSLNIAAAAAIALHVLGPRRRD